VHGKDDDKIGAFDPFVNVANECPAGETAAGDFMKRSFDLLARQRVEDRHYAVDTRQTERLFDCIVTLLFMTLRKTS
jgi:hypothetical protein